MISSGGSNGHVKSTDLTQWSKTETASGQLGRVGMLILEDDLPVGMVDDNDALPAAVENRQRLVTGRPVADEHALEIEMEGSARNRAGGRKSACRAARPSTVTFTVEPSTSVRRVWARNQSNASPLKGLTERWSSGSKTWRRSIATNSSSPLMGAFLSWAMKTNPSPS